jgi:hypothetical protein
VAIREFLMKQARYLRLVAQNNKSDGVNLTPITVVASIDPELLENFIDMEEIEADSVDDCTDESIFFASTQELNASVTAEFVKAEMLAKMTFTISEMDPALLVMKAIADYVLCTEYEIGIHNWQAEEINKASHVDNQAGHPQGSDREQARNE